MEEDIVTTTPEPSPEPDPAPVPEPDPAPAPAPEPDPEPAPAPSEPESSTEPDVTVVSVDELVDRLTQSAPEGEEVPAEEEAQAAIDEGGEVVVEDPMPGLVGDAIDILLGIRSGMKNVESIEKTVNHPLLTTPFQDYTVTEGLLLLMLLCFFVKACTDMVRRAFSWLL